MAFPSELKTTAGATALLHQTMGAYESESPLLAFAVEERETAGFCGLSTLGEGDAELIMCVIVDRACDLAFPRMTAFVCAQNVASRKVVERLGMRDEGIVDRPGFTKGPVHAYVLGG
jgi:[ribosomal protein S5]-alanine N-acetyltransferase